MEVTFAKAGLIDEIILNVEPVVIGKGIPLFSSEEFELSTELVDASKSEAGIATLNYIVKK